MAERTPHRLTTLLLSVVCLLFCITFFCFSIREMLAAHAARQDTLSGFERSVQLSSENAENHARYGMALLFSGNWNGARTQLEAATTLNPGEPQYWLDLARINQIAGNTAQAAIATDRALATGSSYGWVLWEAGLLYLGQNEQAKALQIFRQALQSEALPADRVIDVCWHTTHNTQLLLDSLMTGAPQLYSAFLGVLIQKGRTTDADMVWQHLLSGANNFPPDLSFDYVDFLVRQHRIHDACDAWRNFTQSIPALRPYVNDSSLLENGGFELPLLNGGFEWKYATRPDTAVSPDTGRTHSGQHSLRHDFQAEEIWDGPILQNVCVKPDTTYLFSGFVSTQDLWTLSGPRLRIQDTVSETRFVLSNEFTGTTPWTRYEQVFTTGPDTRMITLSLARIPGNGIIHGTLCLDDISLTEASR
jgi:tetratricopeptide (TPR) repeat protein